MAATAQIIRLETEYRRSWAPPRRLTVDQWANEHRVLSPESSPEPGQWRNANAPHLVAPMQCLSRYHPAERVVCKFSSQTGKTEIALNLIGYVIDVDPGPILCIQPNVDPMVETFSKDRVTPMLRDTPTLAPKFEKRRARDSSSTVKHKLFPGGRLTLIGANSPAGLASRPIRFLIGDELDRWEPTKEGDPLLLARKRTQGYRSRRRSKELLVSSPTYDDVGISAEYDKCTQRYEWHVDCLHCGESQFPRLEHFRIDDNNDPLTVTYICRHCGGEHSLADETAVKAGGHWVQTKAGLPVAIGWWMNQWASPFARWDDTYGEWLDAGEDPLKKQVVTNTAFAEGWQGEGEQIKPEILMARREEFPEDLPPEVIALTIGADVQGDRIEAELVAWGPRLESWSWVYEVFPGDPTSDEVFADLLDFYRATYAHAGGTRIAPIAMAIDSGAYTQHVYAFVKRARERGIFPIKGAAGMTREHVDPDRRKRKINIAKRMHNGKPAEILGVDAIKRTLFHHLEAPTGKTGHCHFPLDRTEEYFRQLTGERLMLKTLPNRRPEYRWTPVYSNVEALDCRAYAYAALQLADPNLAATIPHGARAAASRAAADFSIT